MKNKTIEFQQFCSFLFLENSNSFKLSYHLNTYKRCNRNHILLCIYLFENKKNLIISLISLYKLKGCICETQLI